jgi:hypothetical protein
MNGTSSLSRAVRFALVVALALSMQLAPVSVAGAAPIEEDFPGSPLPASPVVEQWGADVQTRTVRTVSLTDGGSFSATLTPGADLDVDLQLYPPNKTSFADGIAPVASASTPATGAAETIDYTVPATGTYYLVSMLATGTGEASLVYDVTEPPPPPVLSTSLTLAATRLDATTAELTGALTDENDDGISGATVRVEKLDDGSWTTVATTTTGANGAYTTTAPLAQNTTFRTSFDGQTDVYNPSVSNTDEVTVPPTIAWSAQPPATALTGETVPFSVTVAPSHAGVACAGTFTVQHFESGDWVDKATLPVQGTPAGGVAEFASQAMLTSSGDWRVVFDVDADVAHEAGQSISATAAVSERATSLTLAASRADATTAQLSGSLTDELAAPVPGATISIERTFDGQSWSPVKDVVTASDGTWNTTAPLDRTTTFRAVYAGSPGVTLGSTSNAEQVTAPPSFAWVTAPPASVPANEQFPVSVSVTPTHAGTPCAASFKIYRFESDEWALKQTIPVDGVPSGEATLFSAQPVLGYSGQWRIELDLPADDAHEAGVSTPADLVVTTLGTEVILRAEATGTAPAAVTLSGELRSAGLPLEGEQVVVEKSLDGVVWSSIATLTADANGEWSSGTTIDRRTLFRAHYDGVEGVLDPATSAIQTATVAPKLTWVTKPPTSVSPRAAFNVKVTGTPEHHATACSASFVGYRQDPTTGQWLLVDAATTPAAYALSGATGVYTASMKVPSSGLWRIALRVADDDTHGAGETPTTAAPVTAGKTSLSIAANKTTVAVGGPVVLTGYLKNRLGGGIYGKSVRVDYSLNGTTWIKYGTIKSGTGGKLSLTVKPKSRRYYRFRFLGDTSYMPSLSARKTIYTIYTQAGTVGGDFTTKRFWLSKGTRKITMSVGGTTQRIYLHSQDHSKSELLANGRGTYAGTFPVSSAGYAHLKVSGNGTYKVRIWN